MSHSLWGDHVDEKVGVEEDSLGRDDKSPEDRSWLAQLEEGQEMHPFILSLKYAVDEMMSKVYFDIFMLFKKGDTKDHMGLLM